MTQKNEDPIGAFQRDFNALLEGMRQSVVGCERVLEDLLICFFAGGNLLLESPPGLGKTLIAKTLARVMDVAQSRVQFTPDLMPADIVGTTVVQDGADGNKHFVFQKGPVFTQLLIADEINRATPKTQSALLEAMQERRVTTGGKTYDLDKPYFVIATLNSAEHDGTYALPEAQLDRFLFRLRLPQPGIDQLQAISRSAHRGAASGAVIDAQRAREMQALVLAVETPDEARRFAVQLILRTHPRHAGERRQRAALPALRRLAPRRAGADSRRQGPRADGRAGPPGAGGHRRRGQARAGPPPHAQF
ncbi:MAG: AAA family ATPase [Planctomycetota bacterium]|nr:AAA family ATPase [Planctomycetota bacterium]